MAYYKRNGQKLDAFMKDMDYINKGCCAEVYKLRDKDIVFKRYFGVTDTSARLSPLLFYDLKSINNKHFIEIYDLYCKMNKEQLSSYKRGYLNFVVDGYTAKYYEPKDIDILFESSDYFLTNLYELEMLFKYFSDNGILTYDIKSSNTITCSDGIVIIDPDLFYCSLEKNKDILVSNKRNLIALFMEMFRNSIFLYNSDLYFKYNCNIFQDLLNFNLEDNPNLTDTVTKKLKYVKRPIDYLLK